MTTSWRARALAAPCPSCGAKVGDSCVTASGYVTMRHASRRKASVTPPGNSA